MISANTYDQAWELREGYVFCREMLRLAADLPSDTLWVIGTMSAVPIPKPYKSLQTLHAS
jgi:hypothetical protein